MSTEAYAAEIKRQHRIALDALEAVLRTRSLADAKTIVRAALEATQPRTPPLPSLRSIRRWA